MKYPADTKMITATKPGYEDRDFTEQQWGHLGPDKQGWKPKVPSEAEGIDERLVSARENYTKVTGKEASPDKSADYLLGAIEAHLEQLQNAPNPGAVVGQNATVQPASSENGTVNPIGSQPAREGAEGGNAEGGDGSPEKLTAETYKAPRSTEDAKVMYQQVFGIAAPEDANFALIKQTIEDHLGVKKD